MNNRDKTKKNLTRSQQIANELCRKIANREFLPGQRLPTERELSEQFKATRHCIREALKRLEALGLVKIRQGSGTIVQDIDLIGGLELFDILIVDEEGKINYPLIRDILEFRDNVVKEIVRLSAERHTNEELEELKSLFAKRKSMLEDPDELQKVNYQFFRVFVLSTKNQIYELLYNTMWQAFLKLNELVDIPFLGKQEVEKLIEKILEAFEERDGELAELIVSRHLERIRKFIEERIHEIQVKTGASQ
ncbi:MAG: GntR family transcriptional regulator [Candidatus Hydrogenedentes bacterium]|nr:GntR family transcriptional regulator [Candidatus Hydrogenedentota bacterium]